MSDPYGFSSPEDLEDLREETIPGAFPPNPLFNDFPEPDEEERAAAPAPEKEEPEEPAPAAIPEPPPTPPPVYQPSLAVDPATLGQAMAFALQASQPRPRPRPEDFDPPELELPADEDFLEGRASFKKELRRVQVETARHMQGLFTQAMSPVYEELNAHRGYVQSRVPIDEANSRHAARVRLVRDGLAEESTVDELLERSSAVIANRWDYRTSPDGWVAAAMSELTRSGTLPVRSPAKPQPGAGRGDAPTGPPGAKKSPPGTRARKNPHIRMAEQMLGKPLSPDRLAAYEEKFA